MHWDELLELGECWVVSEETVRILEIMTLYTFPFSETLTLKLINFSGCELCKLEMYCLIIHKIYHVLF